MSVALAAAVVAMPAGVATASKVPARFARSLRLPAKAGEAQGLSRAPAGLRAAVARTLGTSRALGGRAVRQVKLTASDAFLVGFSVAISGKTAVVGAEGAAYVFVRSGTSWSQQAELTAPNGVATAFGNSVAVSGQTAVVGAPFENSRGVEGAGAAFVFVRSGTSWSRQAKLEDPAAASTDENFGNSVAVSGQTALVGVPYKNSGAGVAYAFVRSGTSWSEQAELTASDAAANDNFGIVVALSGQTAVLSAYEKNSATGAAYVFVRSGTTWFQQAELTASNGAPGDFFGIDVAISGKTVVVGTEGAADVFVRSGTSWSQQAELTAPNAVANSFAVSVAVSGTTAVVGADAQTSATGAAFAGAAYVFVRKGRTWRQQNELPDPADVTFDFFGASAAISGKTALVGAPDTSSGGAAYVFTHI